MERNGRRDSNEEHGSPGGEDQGVRPEQVIRRTGWRLAKLLGLGLVVNYLVLPQLAGFGRAWDLVTDVEPLLLGAGFALQVGAYLAHAELTRVLLSERHRPSLGDMARIEVASRAVSHVVPGGTAAGTALGFRLLQRRGVPGADAGFAMGTQGIGAAVVLNVLLWGALVVSIPLRGFNPLYATAAALGAVVIGGFGALVLALLRAEERSTRVARSVLGRIPLIDPEKVEDVVAGVAQRLRDLSQDRSVMIRSIVWAALHWISNAASLYVFLLAFGNRPPLDGLIIAFGIANVLAAVPITPRGLGVVEAVLISLLVGFGLTRGEAILGVIAYRLVEFWLPIPVGALAYTSIWLGTSEEEARTRATAATEEPSADARPVEPGREGPRRVLEAVDEASSDSESLRQWADRTGLISRRRPD